MDPLKNLYTSTANKTLPSLITCELFPAHKLAFRMINAPKQRTVSPDSSRSWQGPPWSS